MSTEDPLNGPIYPSFIPKTDSDGNDIAGVRLPDVTVPLATYTGWALRSGPQAHDGCEQAGQYIPFARTEAERLAAGDPRPSVEERYPSFGQYYSEVIRAIDGLVKDRLMLCEDADVEQARLLEAGLNAGVQSTPEALYAWYGLKCWGLTEASIASVFICRQEDNVIEALLGPDRVHPRVALSHTRCGPKSSSASY